MDKLSKMAPNSERFFSGRGEGGVGMGWRTGVQASISKPTSFIYLAFEKMAGPTHSYTWSSKVLTYSYTALLFFETIFSGC